MKKASHEIRNLNSEFVDETFAREIPDTDGQDEKPGFISSVINSIYPIQALALIMPEGSSPKGQQLLEMRTFPGVSVSGGSKVPKSGGSGGSSSNPKKVHSQVKRPPIAYDKSGGTFSSLDSIKKGVYQNIEDIGVNDYLNVLWQQRGARVHLSCTTGLVLVPVVLTIAVQIWKSYGCHLQPSLSDFTDGATRIPYRVGVVLISIQLFSLVYNVWWLRREYIQISKYNFSSPSEIENYFETTSSSRGSSKDSSSSHGSQGTKRRKSKAAIWIGRDSDLVPKESCYNCIRRWLTCCNTCTISNENRCVAWLTRLYRYRGVWQIFNNVTFAVGTFMSIALICTSVFPLHEETYFHTAAWFAYINLSLVWMLWSTMIVGRICSWNPLSEVLKNEEITNANNYAQRKAWCCGLLHFDVRIIDVSDPTLGETMENRVGELTYQDGEFLDLEGGSMESTFDPATDDFPPGTTIRDKYGAVYVVNPDDLESINKSILWGKRLKKLARVLFCCYSLAGLVFAYIACNVQFYHLYNMRNCVVSDEARERFTSDAILGGDTEEHALTAEPSWIMALSEFRHEALNDWENYCKTPVWASCEPFVHLGKAQWVFSIAKVLLLIVIIPYEAETLGLVTDKRERRYIRKKKK